MDFRVFLFLMVVGTSLVSVATPSPQGTPKNFQKILEKELRSITVVDGQMTTARRGEPFPQMVCLDGPKDRRPLSAVCNNMGLNPYGQISWECKYEAPDCEIYNPEVNCEGYDYPDDPFVLVGSCALEYKLRCKPRFVPKINNPLHVCRNEVKTCDVLEACDGTAPDCPVDQIYSADGKPIYPRDYPSHLKATPNPPTGFKEKVKEKAKDVAKKLGLDGVSLKKGDREPEHPLFVQILGVLMFAGMVYLLFKLAAWIFSDNPSLPTSPEEESDDDEPDVDDDDTKKKQPLYPNPSAPPPEPEQQTTRSSESRQQTTRSTQSASSTSSGQQRTHNDQRGSNRSSWFGSSSSYYDNPYFPRHPVNVVSVVNTQSCPAQPVAPPAPKKESSWWSSSSTQSEPENESSSWFGSGSSSSTSESSSSSSWVEPVAQVAAAISTRRSSSSSCTATSKRR